MGGGQRTGPQPMGGLPPQSQLCCCLATWSKLQFSLLSKGGGAAFPEEAGTVSGKARKGRATAVSLGGAVTTVPILIVSTETALDLATSSNP